MSERVLNLPNEVVYYYYYHYYTVGHKKRDTFIFVITLANIDHFS